MGGLINMLSMVEFSAVAAFKQKKRESCVIALI
jgi:hypothetical protein